MVGGRSQQLVRVRSPNHSERKTALRDSDKDVCTSVHAVMDASVCYAIKSMRLHTEKQYNMTVTTKTSLMCSTRPKRKSTSSDCTYSPVILKTFSKYFKIFFIFRKIFSTNKRMIVLYYICSSSFKFAVVNEVHLRCGTAVHGSEFQCFSKAADALARMCGEKHKCTEISSSKAIHDSFIICSTNKIHDSFICS